MNTGHFMKHSKIEYPIVVSDGKVLPKHEFAEQVVVGGFMADRYAFEKYGNKVEKDFITQPRLHLMFLAEFELGLEGIQIDIVTVTDRLASMGLLEAAGGPLAVVEASHNVASTANMEEWVSILRKKAKQRRLILWHEQNKQTAWDETKDIDDIFHESEDAFMELEAKCTNNESVRLYSLIDQAFKQAMEVQSNGAGINTGFRQFDEIFGSFKRGALGIIGGRPAMGKTSFALNIAKKIATEQQIPVGIFSIEMTGIELANSLISSHCGVDSRKINEGRLTAREWDLLDKNISGILNAPIYVDDVPHGLTLQDFRVKARKMVREYGVRIIFIDYLQIMDGGKHFQTRELELSFITRNLKKIAKELDITIIVLSQLNRGVEAREGLEGKRPRLSDLRESGAIEQDADWVLFVHRPEYYHIFQDENGNDLRGMAQIIIAKNRKGITGDAILKFEARFTRFVDAESYNLRNAQPSPDKKEDTNISFEEA